MKAGAEMSPHRGADNTLVRAYVWGLVPNGCGLSVNGEARAFAEGEVLVFEPPFVHAAWNRNPEGRARLVLSIDVWHPDLMTQEVAALQFIERALSEGEPEG
jgi:aspartyl/asparaginyl beta-hydroxylase (cupin superfamily)